MKHILLTTLLAVSSVIAEETRPTFLPFDVTLGGQKAEMKGQNDIFGVVEKPVKPDATLTIGKEAPMLIVNAFACKEDGSVEQNTPAAIIFAQNTATTPLNATMDKKPLTPGTYLMNIVAHQATARVVFTVEDPAAKVKLPSLDSILGFLKKKAS
ncbi:MAG: hypothetical protein EOP88_08295 [Verrucomicrobiaceae bacterium]|nr:MAG: hypothetical protein EOP88_08295 [Verrucomicrobiaceae bacterium]